MATWRFGMLIESFGQTLRRRAAALLGGLGYSVASQGAYALTESAAMAGSVGGAIGGGSGLSLGDWTRAGQGALRRIARRRRRRHRTPRSLYLEALELRQLMSVLELSSSRDATDDHLAHLMLATDNPSIESWTIQWGEGTAAQIVAGDSLAVDHLFADLIERPITATVKDNQGVRVLGLVPRDPFVGASGDSAGQYTFQINTTEDGVVYLIHSDPCDPMLTGTVLSWAQSHVADIGDVAAWRYVVEATVPEDGGYLFTLKSLGATGPLMAVEQEAWVVKGTTPSMEESLLSEFEGYSTCSMSSVAGYVVREYWAVDGWEVEDLTGYGSYQNGTPDSTDQMFGLEFFDESPASASGSRVRGYLAAPESAYYTFWLSADDAAEFWLSNSEDPGYGTLIIELESGYGTAFEDFDEYAQQQSNAIWLDQGNRYYFEVLQKYGGDYPYQSHMAVAWATDCGGYGSISREVISGDYLDSFDEQNASLLRDFEGASDGADAIVLTWAGDSGGCIEYLIERYGPEGFEDNFTVLAGLGNDDGYGNFTYTDMVLIPGTSYTYLIHARDGEESILASADDQVTTDALSVWVATSAVYEASSRTIQAESNAHFGSVTYAWDLDGDNVFGETAGARGNENGQSVTFSGAGLDNPGGYTVKVRAAFGGVTSGTVSKPLAILNVFPLLTVSGNATVTEGSVYTLDLSGINQGNDTITSWTINWGDGTTQTIAGNPTSAEHVYSDGPAEYTIHATATDEDGTSYAKVAVATDTTVLTAGAAGVYSVLSNQSSPGATATVNLNGNTFRQFNATYSGNIIIGLNGVLYMGNTGGPRIWPLWRDWVSTGGNSAVLYKFEYTSGDQTPDQLRVQWTNVRPQEGGSACTFQAILQLNNATTSESQVFLNYISVPGMYFAPVRATWGAGFVGTSVQALPMGAMQPWGTGMITNLTVSARWPLRLRVENMPPAVTITAAEYAHAWSEFPVSLGVVDPGADTVDYFVVHWGDGQSTNHAAGSSVSHTYLHGTAEGIARTITVDVVDGDGVFQNAGSASVMVFSPVIEASGPATALSGAIYTLNLDALLDTPTRLNHWTVDWGDGSAPEEYGRFAESATHLFLTTQTAGESHTIQVKATGTDSSSSDWMTQTLIVAAAGTNGYGGMTVTAVPVTVAEGRHFAEVVAQFTDAQTGSATDYTASISWGDGLIHAAQIVQTGPSSYHVIGEGLIPRAGTAATEITVMRIGFAPEYPASVTPTVKGSAILMDGVYDMCQVGCDDAQLVATFRTDNPYLLPEDFTADIDWGDGTALSNGGGSLSLSGGVFSVMSGHAYERPGDYSVQVIVHEGTRSAAQIISTLVAQIAPLEISAGDLAASAGSPPQGAVAHFTGGNPGISSGQYIAVVDWGDGTMRITNDSGSPLFDASLSITGDWQSGFDVDYTGGHAYSQGGSYQLFVAISDPDGCGATQVLPLMVGECPLVIAPGLDLTQRVHESPVLTLGTVTGFPTAGDLTGISARAFWGDGSTSPIELVRSGATATLVGSHCYMTTGEKSPVLEITFASGQTVQATAVLTVSAEPLVFVPTANLTGPVGRIAALDLGTVTDGDAFFGLADYRATVAWDGGSAEEASVAIGGDGRLHVIHSRSFSTAGTHSAMIAVHNGLTQATGTVDLTVSGGALSLAAWDMVARVGTNLGGPIAILSPEFPGASAGGYQVTIDWGDNSTSSGMLAVQPDGSFLISGDKCYSQLSGSEGFVVTATVVDTLTSASATATAHVRVKGWDILAQGRTVCTSQTASFAGIVATFQSGNVDLGAGDFSATIDWGDHSTGSAVISRGTDGVYSVCPTVAKSYASDHVYTATITIDGAGGAVVHSQVVVGQAPEIVSASDTYFVHAGQSLSIDIADAAALGVLKNDLYPQDATVAWLTIAGPAADYRDDGSFTFSSTVAGLTVLQYIVENGTQSGPATDVFVHVLDTPPTGKDDRFVFNSPSAAGTDGSFTVGGLTSGSGLLVNDYDVDGDVLCALEEVLTHNGGTLTIHADGGFTFRPPTLQALGTYGFTYTVSDGYLTGTGVLTIILRDDPPLMPALTFSTSHGVAVSGNVLTAAGDLNGDALCVQQFENVLHGTLTVSDSSGGFTFVPEAGFTGYAGFDVHVSDSVLVTQAHVTIEVTNNAPVARPITLSLNGTQNALTGIPLQVSDFDGDSLAVELVYSDGESLGTLFQSSAHGMLVLHTGGATPSLSYTLTNPQFRGTETFYYSVSDGVASSGAMPIVITSNNNAPRVVDVVIPGPHGQPQSLNLQSFAWDPEGDALSFSVLTAPGHGTVGIASGVATYTPAAATPHFTGPEGFVIRVSDGAKHADMKVTVNLMNEAPIAIDDEYAVWANRTEGMTFVLAPGSTTNPLANDLDPDGDALIFELPQRGTSNTFSTLLGTVTILQSNTTSGITSFRYNPRSTAGGQDTIPYRITDSAGVSQVATISLVVMQDAVMAISDTIKATVGVPLGFGGQPVNLMTNDLLGTCSAVITQVCVGDTWHAVVPNQNQAFQLGNGSDNRMFTLSAAGVLQYTPAATGIETFKYIIGTDGDASTSGPAALVTLIAQPSQITAQDLTMTLAQGQSVSRLSVASILENHSAGANTTLVLTDKEDRGAAIAAGGSATTYESGTCQIVVADSQEYVEYKRTPVGFSGTDSFTYRLKGPDGAYSNEARVTVTIVGSQGMPTTQTIQLDQGQDPWWLYFQEDRPFYLVNAPLHAAAWSLTNMTVGYQPEPAFWGADEMSYRVFNPDGTTSDETLTFYVMRNALPRVANPGEFRGIGSSITLDMTQYIEALDPNGTLALTITSGTSSDYHTSVNGTSLCFTFDSTSSNSAAITYIATETVGAHTYTTNNYTLSFCRDALNPGTDTVSQLTFAQPFATHQWGMDEGITAQLSTLNSGAQVGVSFSEQTANGSITVVLTGGSDLQDSAVLIGCRTTDPDLIVNVHWNNAPQDAVLTVRGAPLGNQQVDPSELWIRLGDVTMSAGTLSLSRTREILGTVQAPTLSTIDNCGRISGTITGSLLSIDVGAVSGMIQSIGTVAGHSPVGLVISGEFNGNFSCSGDVNNIIIGRATSTAAVIAGGNIGEIQVHQDFLGSISAGGAINRVYSKWGSLGGTLIAGGSVGSIEAWVDVSGNITAGSVGEITALRDISAVINVGANGVGDVTTIMAGGTCGAGAITGAISVAGTLGSVEASAPCRLPSGTNPVPLRGPGAFVTDSGTGELLFDSGYDELFPQVRTPQLGVYRGAGITGGIEAGSIGTIVAYGDVGSTVSHGTLGTFWAAGGAGAIGVASGPLAVTAWGGITGNVTTSGDLTLSVVGDVEGNIRSTQGSITLTVWGNVDAPLVVGSGLDAWVRGNLHTQNQNIGGAATKEIVSGARSGSVNGDTPTQCLVYKSVHDMQMKISTQLSMYVDLSISDSWFYNTLLAIDDSEMDMSVRGPVYNTTFRIYGPVNLLAHAVNNVDFFTDDPVSILCLGDVSGVRISELTSQGLHAGDTAIEAEDVTDVTIRARTVAIDASGRFSGSIMARDSVRIHATKGVSGVLGGVQLITQQGSVGSHVDPLNWAEVSAGDDVHLLVEVADALSVMTWGHLTGNLQVSKGSAVLEVFKDLRAYVDVEKDLQLLVWGNVNIVTNSTLSSEQARTIAIAGSMDVFVGGQLNRTLIAGRNLTVEAWGNVNATLVAGADSPRLFGGATSEKYLASVSAHGHIEGDVWSSDDVILSTSGDLNGVVTARYGSAHVEVLGRVRHSIFAGGDLQLYAGEVYLPWNQEDPGAAILQGKGGVEVTTQRGIVATIFAGTSAAVRTGVSSGTLTASADVFIWLKTPDVRWQNVEVIAAEGLERATIFSRGGSVSVFSGKDDTSGVARELAISIDDETVEGSPSVFVPVKWRGGDVDADTANALPRVIPARKVEISTLGNLTGEVWAQDDLSVTALGNIQDFVAAAIGWGANLSAYAGGCIGATTLSSANQLNVMTPGSFVGSVTFDATLFAPRPAYMPLMGDFSVWAGGSIVGTIDNLHNGTINNLTEAFTIAANAVHGTTLSVMAGGGISGGQIRAGTDASVMLVGNLNSPVTAGDSAGVSVMSADAGTSSGYLKSAVRAIAGQAQVFAHKNIEAAVIGTGGVSVTAMGHLSAPVTAANGNVNVYVSGSISAGAAITALYDPNDQRPVPRGLADVYVAGALGASVMATYDVSVFAGGNVMGAVTSAQGYVNVRALGSVGGDVSGWLGVEVFAAEDVAVAAEILSATGNVNVTAGGGFAGAVSAMGTAQVAAVGAIGGSVCGDFVYVSALGTVSGNIDAATLANVYAGGNLSGAVYAAGRADVTALGSVTGAVTTGSGNLALLAGGTIAANLSVGASAAITSLGGGFADHAITMGTAVQGDLDMTLTGGFHGYVYGQHGSSLRITTLGDLTLLGVNVDGVLDATAYGNVDLTANSGTASGTLRIETLGNALVGSVVCHELDLSAGGTVTLIDLVTAGAGGASLLGKKVWMSNVSMHGVTSIGGIGVTSVEQTLLNLTLHDNSDGLVSVTAFGGLDTSAGSIIVSSGSADIFLWGEASLLTATAARDLSLVTNSPLSNSTLSSTGVGVGYAESSLSVFLGTASSNLTLSALGAAQVTALADFDGTITAGRVDVAIGGDLPAGSTITANGTSSAETSGVYVSEDLLGTLTVGAGSLQVRAGHRIHAAISAGGDLQLSSHGDIDATGTCAVSAGRDLTRLWARGDITGDFTAGRGMVEVISYGSVAADLTVGLGGYPDHSQVDLYHGWGKLWHLVAWGDVDGSITAGYSATVDCGGGFHGTLDVANDHYWGEAFNLLVRDNYPGQSPDDPLAAARAALVETAWAVARSLEDRAGGITAALAALPGLLEDLADQAEALASNPDPAHLSALVEELTAQLQEAMGPAGQEQTQAYLAVLGDLRQGHMEVLAAGVRLVREMAWQLKTYQGQLRAQVLGMLSQSQRRITASALYGQQKRDDAQAVLAEMTALTNQRPDKWRSKVEAFERAQRHRRLAWLSMIDPTGIVSAIDAYYYYIEGDYLMAAQCFVAAIPGLGKMVGLTLGTLRMASNIARIACVAGKGGSLIVGLAAAGRHALEGHWGQAGWALGFGIVGFLTGGCFAAGTQVVVGVDSQTGAWLTRNIEDLRVGDWVLARSESDPDGEATLQQVTQTYQRAVTSLRVITIANGDGTTQELRATVEHPFYVVTGDPTQAPAGELPEGLWTPASTLRPGMMVVDAQGNLATVVAIRDEALATGVAVFNLEVAGDHTYFVLDATGTPVWVHNGLKDCAVMRRVGRLGKQGEAAAAIAKNTRRIVSLSGKRAYRVPDGLTTKTLTEVKNVAYLHFGTQLQDSLHFAIMTGRQMILKVRPTTVLSTDLQAAIRAGWIKLGYI